MNILDKQRNNKGPYIVMEVQGGLGKNILATAVIEALKKKYPERKIIVVTAWEAAYYHNPHIYRVYSFGQLTYFYDEYIFDDTIIMRIDPYHTEDHILKRKHLIKTWCDLYNIPYSGEKPKLYLTPRELEIARDKIKPTGKPILLLQTSGGAQGQYSKKSWARDLPEDTVKKIINFYSKTHRILHVRREDQPSFDGVETLNLPHRELFAVFPLSDKRLFIDSFPQHAAAALNLPSTVCWIVNEPKIFGYNIHKNIKPNVEKKSDFSKYSYLEKYDITGEISQHPYDKLDIFDVNEIINSLKK